MYIYIITLLIPILGFIDNYKKPKMLNIKIVFLLVGLVICFGYTTGTDWRSYEIIYEGFERRSLSEYFMYFFFVEPGYLILNILGNVFHLGFWPWYIIIKFILYLKICDIITKYTPKPLILLAFVFYLGFWGMNNFLDSSFRNMIAAFIFLCGIDYIIRGKFIKFLSIMVLACLFHYSSILMLALYPFFRRSFSNNLLIISFVLLNVLLIAISSFNIFTLLEPIFSNIGGIEERALKYTTGSDEESLGTAKIFSFGLVVHSLFFFLIIYSRRRIELIPYGKFIFNISVIFVFIFRLGLTALIFSRFQLFINSFYAIAVATVIYSFKKDSRSIYALFLVILSYVSIFTQLTNAKFVPYTNYLIHISDDWSFSERSNYNMLNSPYKWNGPTYYY